MAMTEKRRKALGLPPSRLEKVKNKKALHRQERILSARKAGPCIYIENSNLIEVIEDIPGLKASHMGGIPRPLSPK